MGRASRRRKEQTREERTAGREVQPMTFREFVEKVQTAEEEDFARRLGADNDPFPRLLLEREGRVSILAFDGRMTATEEGKNAMTAAGLQAVIANRAEKVAFAHIVWMLLEQADVEASQAGGLMPSENPNRVEAHILTVLDRERVETYIARVERLGEEKRGHLRPWNEDFGGAALVDDAATDTYVDSRFINPIKEALK